MKNLLTRKNQSKKVYSKKNPEGFSRHRKSLKIFSVLLAFAILSFFLFSFYASAYPNFNDDNTWRLKGHSVSVLGDMGDYAGESNLFTYASSNYSTIGTYGSSGIQPLIASFGTTLNSKFILVQEQNYLNVYNGSLSLIGQFYNGFAPTQLASMHMQLTNGNYSNIQEIVNISNTDIRIEGYYYDYINNTLSEVYSHDYTGQNWTNQYSSGKTPITCFDANDRNPFCAFDLEYTNSTGSYSQVTTDYMNGTIKSLTLGESSFSDEGWAIGNYIHSQNQLYLFNYNTNNGHIYVLNTGFYGGNNISILSNFSKSNLQNAKIFYPSALTLDAQILVTTQSLSSFPYYCNYYIFDYDLYGSQKWISDNTLISVALNSGCKTPKNIALPHDIGNFNDSSTLDSLAVIKVNDDSSGTSTRIGGVSALNGHVLFSNMQAGISSGDSSNNYLTGGYFTNYSAPILISLGTNSSLGNTISLYQANDGYVVKPVPALDVNCIAGDVNGDDFQDIVCMSSTHLYTITSNSTYLTQPYFDSMTLSPNPVEINQHLTININVTNLNNNQNDYFATCGDGRNSSNGLDYSQAGYDLLPTSFNIVYCTYNSTGTYQITPYFRDLHLNYYVQGTPQSINVVGQGQGNNTNQPIENSSAFAGIVNPLLGIFPASNSLSFGAKIIIVLFVMLLIAIGLFLLGHSLTDGLGGALAWIVLLIEIVIFFFFIGIGYIPIEFLIIIVAIASVIIFFRIKGGN